MRKSKYKGPPLTTEEQSGIAKPAKLRDGKPILCCVCHRPGGTMVKIDNLYRRSTC